MVRPARTAAGTFRRGVSGNPAGRPPRSAALVRQDAASPVRPATRQDGYANAFTGHGTTRDRRVFTQFRGEIVTDIEALDLWETEFLAARIIEALPEEAYRRGWSMKLQDEELAEAVTTWAGELGAEHAIVEAAEKERALGGSAIFPVIDGAQRDLALPIDWGAISNVTALHVLEPRELTPVDFDNNFGSPHFRMPSQYMFTPITSGWGSTYGMQIIHASRLVIFPGLRVTHQVRNGQRLGWGTSVLSRPKGVLADFGLAWGSAATLLHEHGVGVLEMDQYAELMATDEGEAIVARRLAGMMMAKSTLKALVVDKNDKYTRLASSLSGLAEVLNEFKVLMSAASDGMPVSVLMGQSQSGLRTGDDDTRTWYANVEKRRAKHYMPRHKHLMRFLLAAGNGPTRGSEPDVYSVEYPSLWSPSAQEIATTRKAHMDTAAEAVGSGIVSADDVAESFFGPDMAYPENGDIRINWERRKAQAALASGPGDMGPEDKAAMGRGDDPEGDDEDLSDEDLADLAALQDEFPDGEDGGDAGAD